MDQETDSAAEDGSGLKELAAAAAAAAAAAPPPNPNNAAAGGENRECTVELGGVEGTAPCFEGTHAPAAAAANQLTNEQLVEELSLLIGTGSSHSTQLNTAAQQLLDALGSNQQWDQQQQQLCVGGTGGGLNLPRRCAACCCSRPGLCSGCYALFSGSGKLSIPFSANCLPAWLSLLPPSLQGVSRSGSGRSAQRDCSPASPYC
jgi:hypothetical protein